MKNIQVRVINDKNEFIKDTIVVQLKDFFLSSLQEIKQILNSQTIQLLEMRLLSIHDDEEQIVKFTKQLFQNIVNKIKEQQQIVVMKSSETDYLALQDSLQKMEKENRSHIRIEQQMQLFVQQNEEKMHNMQIQVDRQRKKGQYLTEKIKILEDDNQKLLQKLNKLEHEIIYSKCQTKNPTPNYYTQNQLLQASKHSLKRKQMIERIIQRDQRLSDQKLCNNLHHQEDETGLRTYVGKISQKLKIFNRGIKRKNVSHQGSIRDLSKSIHTRLQQKHQVQKGKLSKVKTEEVINIVKLQRRSSLSHCY